MDLRRAISSAYYGVFHGILTAAADEFAGATRRTTRPYVLLYRSVDHRALRDLCETVNKANLPSKYRQYAPANGFDRGIKDFAAGFLELQQKRHSADYDPLYKVRSADAAAVVKSARSALTHFRGAGADQRLAFFALLLFPPG